MQHEYGIQALWDTRDKHPDLPAIFLSRIFRQIASAFRIGQFSILVEKLRKNRYSLSVTDIRRAISVEFSVCGATVRDDLDGVC